MSSHTIRASEIAAFVFCQRAWLYSRLGIQPENVESLSQGTLWHLHHGRQVVLWRWTRTLGFLAILTAIVLAAIALVSTLSG
ncbi:MAG: hypothetical protein E3J30_04305 [Anaerolineales bacterium]|nr:MAG: hypothetical protein E3J30_04305 [Anaerolineales bacterium]